MAVCSQIATGVFLISWTNPDYGLTGQFDVAITEVQQFCTIQTYKIVHRKVTFLLTTSTMRNSTVADQVWQVKSVKLIRRGVQHPMQYQNSKWIATLDVKSMDWKARFDIVIDFNCQNMLMVKKESKMVVDRMLHLWLTKDYADITFDVGQKKIKAHRLVIINAGCPAVADLFKDDYQLEVSIHGVQPDAFDKLLRFIYTGDADIERSTVWDLFMAGRKYGLDSLIEQCAVYISRNLSVENSTEYLLGSYQHNFSSLYRYTLDFMSKNGKAITSRPEWTEIKQRYPEVCITAMQAMITGYNPKDFESRVLLPPVDNFSNNIHTGLNSYNSHSNEKNCTAPANAPNPSKCPRLDSRNFPISEANNPSRPTTPGNWNSADHGHHSTNSKDSNGAPASPIPGIVDGGATEELTP